MTDNPKAVSPAPPTAASSQDLVLPSLVVAGSFLSPEWILQIVNLAMTILVMGVDVVKKFAELEVFLKKLIAESRNPTQDEWAIMVARSDLAHWRIQNARKPPTT